MLQSYVKIAIRNLLRRKVCSVINIAGLAVGLAGFIVISTYIKNELSYDSFHGHAERIYRPVELQKPPGVDVQHVAVTMGPLAEALLQDFSEIESACRIMPSPDTLFLTAGGKGFYEDGSAFADQAFLDMFTVPLAMGDRASALEEPNSLVISETLARKYYADPTSPTGYANPIGETFTTDYPAVPRLRVSGVMEDYPENSHLSFRYLISLNTIPAYFGLLDNWNSNSMATYVRLRDGVDPAVLESRFPSFLESHLDKTQSWNEGLEMYLQPLSEIHLQAFTALRNRVG